MFAVEFQASIPNGFIEIPEEYRSLFDRQRSVKVILFKEEEKAPSQDIIDRLLNNPLQVDEFKPLKRDEIYNPFK